MATEEDIRREILLAIINCTRKDHPSGADRPDVSDTSMARRLQNAVFSSLKRREFLVLEGPEWWQEHIIEAVLEIDTDIGMTYYSQPASDLEVRVSAHEPLMAIVASGHTLAK
jgi:hypothetical protein